MNSILHNSLNRLDKALGLMHELLQEEYSYLQERNTDAIMSIEFSIHELLRQLAHEKEGIRSFLGGGKLKDYIAMLPEEDKAILSALWQNIDDKEQACAKQSSRNTNLSLGLLDQSKEVLDFLHKRLLPKEQTAYDKYGEYIKTRPQANLIFGRF